MSWTAPSNNGGSSITGYSITPYIGATAQTANGKIARVLPAHLDKYRNAWGQTEYYESNISQRTVFVVM